MAVTRVSKTALSAFNAALVAPPAPAPVLTTPVDVKAAERLRVDDVAAYLKISRRHLYYGIKKGRYPPPDGRDGKMSFWWAATVAKYSAATR